MAKRHNDALAINCGACNPSGIAHAIVEACAELRAEPGFSGTDQIRSDPAIRLMVNQLSFLMGNGEMPTPGYEACVDACKLARDAEEEAIRKAAAELIFAGVPTVEMKIVECDPDDMRGFMVPRC